MGDNSERVGIYLVAGLLLGVMVMALGYGIPRWNLSSEVWLGDRAILDYILQVLTIAVGAGAASAALLTLRMNLYSGISQRFQSGLQLYCSNSEASISGGLAIMMDAVRARPKIYSGPLVQAVVARIAEQSSEKWHQFYETTKALPYDAGVTIGNLRSLRALAEVPFDSTKRDRRTVFRPYFNMVMLEDLTFERYDFKNVAFGNGSFNRCNFVDCTITIQVRERMIFDECTFTNTTIEHSRDAVRKRHGVMQLTGCNPIQLKIDGSKITEDGEY